MRRLVATLLDSNSSAPRNLDKLAGSLAMSYIDGQLLISISPSKIGRQRYGLFGGRDGNSTPGVDQTVKHL